MAVKKTIAIVGATEETGTGVVNHFASMPYRLLLVSENEDKLEKLTDKLKKMEAAAEIEPLVCVKDSCWEADIIIIAVSPEEEIKVAELMKEVATQKIVVVVLENENDFVNLESVLPYSKVVKASISAETNKVTVNGNCETVNEEIMQIFDQAGYHISPSIN